MRGAILLLALVAFTSCARGKEWDRPGATPQAFGIDEAACRAQAYRRSPVMMQSMGGSSPPPPSAYVCQKQGFGVVRCDPDNPSRVQFADPGPVDVGAGGRRAEFDACMHQRGWHEIRR